MVFQHGSDLHSIIINVTGIDSSVDQVTWEEILENIPADNNTENAKYLKRLCRNRINDAHT
ncbi:hypothetical protein Lepto7375DRAFT_7203 [Leptolyngbya sp. PCC 7375]|nr:hypothetical protein Lepto7375DRAFT_7203 [Leptolyngbya sp. PCC 7375]